MAYSADRKPGELTALTTLATDDVIVVGDTSDASEVAKGITKANLITDLTTSFATAGHTHTGVYAPVLGADDNYVTDAEKTSIGTIGSKAPSASPTFTGTVTLPKTTEIQDTTGDHQYVLAVSELAADRTVTLPLLTGADEFVFKDFGQTLTNKTLTSPTLTTPSAFTTGGTITLAENTSIALDPAGSADGKYSGITIAGTAGAALAFGDLCYLAVADSRWELADADATATMGTPLLGMCVLAAGADGNATTMLLYGTCRADAKFPALTIGATVYGGETAGGIQTAIPTGADSVIRVVGHALTADEIMFNPSQDHQITVA